MYERRLEENKELIDTVQAAAQEALHERKHWEEAAEAAGRRPSALYRASTFQYCTVAARRVVLRQRGDPEATKLTFIQVLAAAIGDSDDNLCNFVARVVYDHVKADYLDHDLKYTGCSPADDAQAAPDDDDDGDDDDDYDAAASPALSDDPDRALLAEAAQSRCGCPSA